MPYEPTAAALPQLATCCETTTTQVTVVAAVLVASCGTAFAYLPLHSSSITSGANAATVPSPLTTAGSTRVLFAAGVVVVRGMNPLSWLVADSLTSLRMMPEIVQQQAAFSTRPDLDGRVTESNCDTKGCDKRCSAGTQSRILAEEASLERPPPRLPPQSPSVAESSRLSPLLSSPSQQPRTVSHTALALTSPARGSGSCAWGAFWCSSRGPVAARLRAWAISESAAAGVEAPSPPDYQQQHQHQHEHHPQQRHVAMS